MTKLHNSNVKLFRKTGFLETFTCVPFLTGNIVREGMIFSWSESSAVLAGNTLFGARGNRDAAPISLASAITGLTPEMLLHKAETRHAELLVHIEGLDVGSLNYADFGALGYHIGAVAGARKVAVTGLPSGLSYEELKYFITPMGVSGAVALCLIVGTSPGAPTLEAALGGGKPDDTITVGKKEMEEAYHVLNTAKTDDVDFVSFGCPHLTISEIKRIAQLLDGKRVKDGVQLWVSTADVVHALARRSGYVDIIEKAGGLVIADTCTAVAHRYLKVPAKNSATNSAKAAAYHVRNLGVQYGSTEQCVAAAITGKWRG